MIQILSENIINKIAAGEVVERPASIVKELLENSIDAGATEVKILINDAGLSKIQISDNGHGIARDDLKNLFKKHATSKLLSIDDLESIQSFGFRGEALASISSVAYIQLITKHESDIHGTEVHVENSVITLDKPSGQQCGTTIIVQDLFEKIPARKKFLKSSASEKKWIIDVIHKYILAYPAIHFEIRIDEVEKIYEAASAKDRIARVLKTDIKDIIDCSYDGKVKITGYLVHPKHFLKNRNTQFMYVNNRPISDSIIAKAVIDGHDTFLMKNQYPGYVIFIEIPGTEVDINVHPRKSEVRFSNPGELYTAVRTSVNSALVKSLRQETLQKFNSSEINHESDTVPETTIVSDPVKEYVPTSNIDAFEAFLNSPQTKKENPAQLYQKNQNKQALIFNQEVLIQGTSQEEASSSTHFLFNINDAHQYLNSYIITTSKDAILIIDQHAASERYFYEKYLKQLRENLVVSKPLLIPEIYTLDDFEIDIVTKNKDVFVSLGFAIEVFGVKEIKVTAVPDFIKLQDFLKTFKKLLDDLLEFDDISNQRDKIFHEIAAILACHTAVRFGDTLKQEEIKQLLKNLMECEDPYNCPHGRPVIQEFSKFDIEKKFKRCSI